MANLLADSDQRVDLLVQIGLEDLGLGLAQRVRVCAFPPTMAASTYSGDSGRRNIGPGCIW